MLVEPRHDLDEIAGTRAVIELGSEDAVPGIAAGAGDPGRQKMKVAPATPAVARLCTVEVPILAWLSMWKAMEKPSIRFSNSGSIASGVTSRPVKPVPPVVMMASTPARRSIA